MSRRSFSELWDSIKNFSLDDPDLTPGPGKKIWQDGDWVCFDPDTIPGFHQVENCIWTTWSLAELCNFFYEWNHKSQDDKLALMGCHNAETASRDIESLYSILESIKEQAFMLLGANRFDSAVLKYGSEIMAYPDVGREDNAPELTPKELADSVPMTPEYRRRMRQSIKQLHNHRREKGKNAAASNEPKG